MIITSMTSKGQIVIPAQIRARYGMKKGSRIAIQEEGDKIILRAVTPEFIRKMAGALSSEVSLTKELLRQRKTDRLKEGKKCR